MKLLGILWTFAVGIALGPLLFANDRPIINQHVLIRNSVYFQQTSVDFENIKSFAIKLFTFNSALMYLPSEEEFQETFTEVSHSKSWLFMEQFVNQWSGTNFQFELFKG